MSSYPPTAPSPTRQPLPAEEYELPHLPVDNEAGPSRRRSSGTKTGRTLTLHPAQSTANLLFSAPGSAGATSSYTPRKRHSRTHSIPDSPEETSTTTPRRYNRAHAHFLNEHEDHNDLSSRDAEQVHLPDFGHMLGFIDEGEDHFAIAQGMKTRWKRKLYLLLEEPSSGREAFFVHVLVTGVILFR